MSPHHCPEQQVQYPNASWACPYRCSLGFPNSQGQYCIIFPPGLLLPQPMSKTMVDPDIHTSSLTHKSQGSPVVLMTWSYLLLKPHLPVIPLLRFLASFICIVFHQSRSSFRFSKPGSLSAPASVHSVPFSQTALFLITPLTYAPGLFLAKCWGLSFSVPTSWEAFLTTLHSYCVLLWHPCLIPAYHIPWQWFLIRDDFDP